MPKNLVIVESPAKARTIERYLGEDYRVLASYGHVRDLPENPGKGKFGVDVDNDFAPEYVINDDRRKQVSEIEKAARGSDTVFLATDLDREGEAIAWHVAEAAHVPAAKTRRVTFSEITESAIREAFAHPRDIDQNLVDAQQTRRIVDRLVGYTLSPLIGKKVRRGLSAGRVQSVAVRLVVERERAIDAFTTREYWTIQATLATSSGDTFAAELVRIDGEALDIADEVAASRHVTALRDASPVVRKVTVRTQKRSPAAPFTTSTLQQEASRKLSFSPKRTMSVAQRLYEGMATPDGQVGLITYMRTDSTAIAGVAMGEAREVIAERYGDAFTMPKGRVYKTKAKGAQEAHESIRPTSFRRDPDSLVGVIPADELRLYRLIWQRALASQMAPKELETTTIDLADMPYELRASATKTLFEGFARVYTEGRDDAAEDEDEDGAGQLPALAESDATSVREVTPTQHFTEPPPRFTEATLIKALEEHGIGRPSTYAATISTILDRGYVRVEERRLHPDPLALVVTDYLVEHFGDYVDLAFTARMEEELDEVATGERAWVPLLRAFYGPLTAAIRTADDLPGPVTPTDEVCSEGHPMVIRFGRNGRFLACSLYPDHKETRPLPEDAPPPQEGEGEPCPECGQGTLVGKSGRFGPFVGCSRYPDCKFIKKDGPPPPDPLPFEVVCPKNQDGLLVPRRARRTGNVFWGCAKYPKCDFTTNHEPLGGVHDADDGPLARKGETAICLRCGSASDTAPDDIVPGERYAGGPADPAALARPARAGRAAGGPRGGGRGRAAGARTGGARATGRRTSPPEPAAGA
ncbi:MAG: type I DNA topoisomerase [Chloroflexota bacterium]